MKLTKQNASQYVGKTIDADKRLFGDYPFYVTQFPNGEYIYIGSCGVCQKVPDEKDKFNSVYFDKIIDDIHEDIEDGGAE